MSANDAAINAALSAWVRTPDLDLTTIAGMRIGLDAAAEHIAAAERERLAAHITRAAARTRSQAEAWWSADHVRADAWDEVAGWCRDDTIWKESS